MHLIVDSRNCGNTSLLRDPVALKKCLIDMVDVAKMHRFGEPIINDYPFPGQDGTALSAVVFLGESSLVVHTYPEHEAVFIDVFHCMGFDPKALYEWIVDKFRMDLSATDIFVLERGLGNSGVPIITRLLNAEEVIK